MEVWHRQDGQLYRMPHNFEAQYLAPARIFR